MKNLLCIDEQIIDDLIVKYTDLQSTALGQAQNELAIGYKWYADALGDLKAKMKSCEAVWNDGWHQAEQRFKHNMPDKEYNDFVSNTKFEDL